MRVPVYCMAVLLSLFGASACSGKSQAAAGAEAQPVAEAMEKGDFSADSAYANVDRQVKFGPRTPGSAAHDACRDWLVASLRTAGADTVYTIGTPAVAWDSARFPVDNVFARFNSGASKRVILLAHYDTRPWADHDPDESLRLTPIDGANDGASGVGVLLEVARNLGLRSPEIGVDILLTDAEDYGARDGEDVDNESDTWCLGAQQFVERMPYTASDMPYMGILLDMVGGRDAVFPIEYFSARYAQNPTARLWGMADKLGHGKRFPQRMGGAITDDHLPLIRAGIPVTDVIESANPATGSFNPTWHTHADNMDNIDPKTLGVVGEVVLAFIYNEKP